MKGLTVLLKDEDRVTLVLQKQEEELGGMN